MYEKTDRSGLYRDVGTGAIVNRDARALDAYKLRKQKSQEVQSLQERQDRIESELYEIKNLLKSALMSVTKDDY